jgi:hypothetical protein
VIRNLQQRLELVRDQLELSRRRAARADHDDPALAALVEAVDQLTGLFADLAAEVTS